MDLVTLSPTKKYSTLNSILEEGAYKGALKKKKKCQAWRAESNLVSFLYLVFQKADSRRPVFKAYLCLVTKQGMNNLGMEVSRE